MDITFLLQLLISGTAIGCMYGVVALGHVLIWNALGVLNFAHSEMVMLGAFFSLTFFVTLELPYWLTFLLVPLVGCLLGCVIQRTMYRYLFRRKADRESFVIASIGLQVILINLANITWGKKNFSFPDIFQSKIVNIGGSMVPVRYFFVLGVALLLVVVLTTMLKKTKIGTAMRAVAQDREIADSIGINVALTDMLTFAIASALGCIAGLLLAPLYLVTAGMGQTIALKGFSAAVIGGFSSLWGTIVGGVFLGVCETVVAGVFGGAFKDIAAFVVLLLVLYIKPTGLVGTKR